MLPKPRQKLPSLPAGQLNQEDQKLVALGVGLAFDHRCDTKVQLGKIVVGDSRFCRIHKLRSFKLGKSYTLCTVVSVAKSISRLRQVLAPPLHSSPACKFK